jgi:hypothetical protein
MQVDYDKDTRETLRLSLLSLQSVSGSLGELRNTEYWGKHSGDLESVIQEVESAISGTESLISTLDRWIAEEEGETSTPPE